MKKILAFLLFIPAAIMVASVFGALHDQISYSLSPEYFTKFKFIQFNLFDSDAPERIRASIVGIRASWWMGIPLGVLCGAAGFIQRTPEMMRRALLWSLPLIAGITLMVALAGLALGYAQTVQLDLAGYPGWFIPGDLDFPRRYLCVGYMHNAAYIGGALAIPVAWLFHIGYRLRTAKK